MPFLDGVHLCKYLWLAQPAAARSLGAAVDGKLNFGRVCLIHFVLFVLPAPLGTGTVYAPLHSMHTHKALF